MAKSTRIDICMSIKYGEVIPINHYTFVHHYRNLVLKIFSNINITVDFMVYFALNCSVIQLELMILEIA